MCYNGGRLSFIVIFSNIKNNEKRNASFYDFYNNKVEIHLSIALIAVHKEMIYINLHTQGNNDRGRSFNSNLLISYFLSNKVCLLQFSESFKKKKKYLLNINNSLSLSVTYYV